MNKVLAHINRIIKLVELIYHVINLVCLLGIAALLPFYVTTSKTLRQFIVVFGIIGGVLGYYFTATGWAGKKRAKCLRRRNLYLAILWFPFVIFLGTLVVLSPQFVMKYPPLESIREFLIVTSPLHNFIVGLAAAFALYLLIGAITLSSSKLSRP